MKVMFVSQCTKHALVETRRIIDQFGERKGDCVWQTNITEQGLETVKRLLKATARRNTAVACHLFRGRQQTELLWIVGNARKFNREGSVPTNMTTKDILRADDENDWNTGEAIALMGSIAALFHDFGKANALFQKKLRGKNTTPDEPFRHEWISLLLFQHFVMTLSQGKSDKGWLEKLSQISEKDEELLLKNFPHDHQNLLRNPLKDLPRISKFIGWLILSHHRLPVPPSPKDDENAQPRLEKIKDWMDGNRFSASWNSHDKNKWSEKDFKQVLTFPHKTPFSSSTWCLAGRKAALRALKHYDRLDSDWFQDRFSMHLTRAVLMLSDHCYSGEEAHPEHQDRVYGAYANTDRKSKSLKQRLDEHNIGVARGAFFIAKRLPKFRETLPVIVRNKYFKQRNHDLKFGWQDKAYDLACGLKEISRDRGFFGVNLASTGCGKTLANARVMYGLSDETEGCRFSIALGLRVLTLQTGEALKNRLKLKDDDIAVVIGSSAFQELHGDRKEAECKNNSLYGSESLEELVQEGEDIQYEGCLDDGYLGRWLKSAPKLHKIVSAPILVCTIDHLILATEGLRGGKQIAPLLRLLTADLVLDEPDDFDVADLPALCRLVNFAGVFGSRVLLSSATLPPSLVQALFEAYAAGRKSFNAACKKSDNDLSIPCAWFDEFGLCHSEHLSPDSYRVAHRAFVASRIEQLDKQAVLRRASLVSVESSSNAKHDIHVAVAQAIRSNVYDLHGRHHQVCPSSGKKVSIGLVRMANIDPMVAVAKEFVSTPSRSDYCIHFCVYHSRFTMLMRSKIERALDSVLSRHNPDDIWKKPEVMSALSSHSASHHIFVVFATAVAEVGRDHDYDWAVIEPSSMRSIIQLAGRIQRHRRISPSEVNIRILHKNIKGLQGCNDAYVKPGFESKNFRLVTKDLFSILHPHQFEEVTAKPRLCSSASMDYTKNLVDLEHARLEGGLFGTKTEPFHASLWWKKDPDWCGQIQRLSPFRKENEAKIEYIDYQEEEGESPRLHTWSKNSELIPVEHLCVERVDFTPVSANCSWITGELGKEIERYSQERGLSVEEVSRKFAKVDLEECKDGTQWSYHQMFGFFRA